MLYSADTLHKLAEVQTTFHWKATFSGAPFPNGDGFSKRMTSSTLPQGQHKKIDVAVHGYVFPGPGIIDRAGSVTLNFFESVTADIVKDMIKWQADIYAADGSDVTGVQRVGHQSVFGEVKLELMDKQDAVKQTYELHRCILSSFDAGGSLEDGSSPNYFKPVLTIDYAWFNWK